MNFLDQYHNCQLCPRKCKVDRSRGKVGVCGETSELRISHVGPHFGEEPSISGSRGSGTIFFDGCSSRCFFCQNYQISAAHHGEIYSADRFFETVKDLIDKKVHNLNFVTPDHFWPHIKELCLKLRALSFPIPKVFNSSGYQLPEMISEYSEFMDIFMPDFKFADPDLARECMGDERYPEIALEAIREMVDARGFLDPWDPSGERVAERGVLVRHLVLPGHVENSLETLDQLHAEFGDGLPISVMSQFRPVPACFAKNSLTRGVTPQEYDLVLAKVKELGFEKVYTQILSDQTDYLPDFNNSGDPFPGHRK
ncbi:MAG: Radical SAM superfamily protein [Candidatus Omnitrophica bacterium ADurb.Bin292]|nr:MAG: Radical SAM superfamily protein [Candidatus Omnitrophica bacterium ADurb.Bin292]